MEKPKTINTGAATFDGASKILRHPHLIAAYKRKTLASPITVEIDLTNHCPHKCPRCTGGASSRAYLTNAKVISIIDEIASYGTKAVVFTGGGEPLVHPDAISIMAKARRAGLDVGLITNGTILPHMPSSAAHRIVQNCLWIRVSIDAGTPEIYKRTHGVAGFDDAWKAVELLADASRDSESVTPATVGVGYLVGRETVAGMQSAAIRARHAGANYIQFRPFLEEMLTVPEAAVANEIARCRSLERPGFFIGYVDAKFQHERKLRGRSYDTCHGSYFTVAIQADGNVVVCCHQRGNSELYGGNIHNETFRSIWEGPQMQKVRGVDPHKCIPLCHHDMLNETIEHIMSPLAHENFL